MEVTWKSQNLLVYILLIMTASLTPTHQELADGFSWHSPVSDVMRSSPGRISNLVQQKIGAPSALRNVPAATQGNGSVEKLNESLTRLEESLASLIQSFLSLQRSVFSLEQLQELLVLLLEDILKQTGKMDQDSNRENEKTHEDSDSATKTDKDSYDDSEETDGGTQDVDGDKMLNNKVMPNANNAGNGHVSQDNYPLQSAGMVNGHENMFGGANNPNLVMERQALIPSRGESASSGRSSEGGRSLNEEVNFKQGPGLAAAAATEPRDKFSSRSQRPTWSEPISVPQAQGIRAQFQDVVRHIVARMRPSRQTHSASQALSMFQVNPHPSFLESTLERRSPELEPNEVKWQAQNVRNAKGSKHSPETLPFHAKQLYGSPVISHGSPAMGPEPNSSPFLEHFGTQTELNISGERPTGMINNLVQSPIGKESNLTKGDTQVATDEKSAPHGEKISFPQSRWRRETRAIRGRQPRQVGMMLANKTIVGNDFNADGLRNQDNIIKAQMPDMNISTFSEEVSVSQHSGNLTLNTSDTSSKLQEAMDTNYSAQNYTAPEYDFLIASLLKDLNSKLHEYQMRHHEVNITNDGVINQVASELNKLIWIPSDDASQMQTTISMKTERYMSQGLDNITLSNGTDSNNETLFWGSTRNEEEPSQMDHKKEQRNPIDPKQNDTGNVNDQFIKLIGNYSTEEQSGVQTPANATITTTTYEAQQENTSVLLVEQTTSAHSTVSEPKEEPDSSTNSWDWIQHLPSGGRSGHQQMKWGMLIEMLTNLSRLEDFAEEMQSLSDRGRTLVQSRPQSGMNEQIGYIGRDNDMGNERRAEINSPLAELLLGDGNSNVLQSEHPEMGNHNDESSDSASSNETEHSYSNDDQNGSREEVWINSESIVDKDGTPEQITGSASGGSDTTGITELENKLQDEGTNEKTENGSNKSKSNEDNDSENVTIDSDENDAHLAHQNTEGEGSSPTQHQRKKRSSKAAMRHERLLTKGYSQPQANLGEEGTMTIEIFTRTSQEPTKRIRHLAFGHKFLLSPQTSSHSAQHHPHIKSYPQIQSYSEDNAKQLQRISNSLLPELKFQTIRLESKNARLTNRLLPVNVKESSLHNTFLLQHGFQDLKQSLNTQIPNLVKIPHQIKKKLSRSPHHTLIPGNHLNYMGPPILTPPNLSNSGPKETPSMDKGSPVDLEEVLNNLFQAYWQKANSLYSQPPNSTTTIKLDNATTTKTTSTKPEKFTTPMPTTYIADSTATAHMMTTLQNLSPKGDGKVITETVQGVQGTAQHATEKSAVSPDIPVSEAANPTTNAS